MQYENLLYETAAGVATITLNRPQALNALNRATVGELSGALKMAGDDPGVRVVILTGAGEKAFIGGADVKEMLDRVKAGSAAASPVTYRSGLIDPFLNLGKPIIAGGQWLLSGREGWRFYMPAPSQSPRKAPDSPSRKSIWASTPWPGPPSSYLCWWAGKGPWRSSFWGRC